MQLFSNTLDIQDLPHFHTFGYPTYCFDSNLQAGQPKAN